MSQIAHEKITGLDRDRLLAAVEPVLLAHGVVGVELLWKTDRTGRVLELTIERPDSLEPGGGVTLDLCGEISRDVSAALDLAEVIDTRYSLLVGSPGLERGLYSLQDYARFKGRRARLKLVEALDGQMVVHGELLGLDDAGEPTLNTEWGVRTIPMKNIDQARLVFEWSGAKVAGSFGNRSANGNGQKSTFRAKR
ncbi:MAG: ribosome maturation factor RimP [Polyangiaceae bacterium]|nr:ribosome maturation factor RimP [Polyangiaceae bacterium]